MTERAPQFCSLFNEAVNQTLANDGDDTGSTPEKPKKIDYEKAKALWEQHEAELLEGTPEELVAKFQNLQKKGKRMTQIDLDDCNQIVRYLLETQSKVYYKAVETGCIKMGCKDRSMIDDAERKCIIFDGLRKALKGFDCVRAAETQAAFSTYAYMCILNETKTWLKRAYQKNSSEISLDMTINESNDGKEMTMYDKVGNENYSADNAIFNKDIEHFCHKLFAKYLDPQSEYIVVMSFGLFGEPIRTESEIGSIMNLSQASVSKRLGDSIEILKRCVTEREHELLILILRHKVYADTITTKLS